MEKSFYKDYIEVEKDYEKVLFIILDNSDLLLNYAEEVLFEEGELMQRKTLLSKSFFINEKMKKVFKQDLFAEKVKKEWKVYTQIETEIESCGAKSQSILEAFDIRNEKKMNLRISKLLNSKLNVELNYGFLVKNYLRVLTSIIDIKENDIISKIAKNIALKWYPIYSKNIEKANEFLFNKGIGINIKDDEINVKPKIEKNKKIEGNEEKESWGFESKIRKVFDERKADSEIVMGDRKTEENIDPKNVYEMIGSILLNNNDLKKLYANKRVVHPKNLLKNVSDFEKNNIYGFENIKEIFDDKIIPKENLSVLKMVSDLFEKILEDENLNSENKLLLCKLQYPIIKTSLISKEEIINDESVVNKVMRKITNEIKLIPNPNSQVFIKIKEFIDDFSKKDFENISIDNIKKEWEKLLNFIDKNEKKVLLIEARNKEKELGLYYFTKAEKEVDKDISSILLDSEFVDQNSCNFIEDIVRNNLLITKLKDIKEKDNKYEKQIVVLETWFNSLFVFNNKQDANKYSKLLFSILIENNYSKKSIYSDGIRKIYQKVFSQKSLNVKEEAKEEFQKERYSVYSELFKETKEKNEVSSSESKIFEDMNYGDWIEIVSEGSIKNCKLLLKLDNNKKFIFVDSNGRQNLSSSIKELVEMKNKKCLKFLQKTTVIERALDKVLSA